MPEWVKDGISSYRGYRGYDGIMEKKMETTLQGLGLKGSLANSHCVAA